MSCSETCKNAMPCHADCRLLCRVAEEPYLTMGTARATSLTVTCSGTTSTYVRHTFWHVSILLRPEMGAQRLRASVQLRRRSQIAHKNCATRGRAGSRSRRIIPRPPPNAANLLPAAQHLSRVHALCGCSPRVLGGVTERQSVMT